MAEAQLYNGVALVGYVDGVPVDANGNEVQGAPPKAPDTDPSMQPHVMAALNTEERSAAILANALAVALGRAPAGPVGGTGQVVPPELLPTLSDLPGTLAGMTDVAAIRAMEAADTRKGAAAAYDARLAELGG